jgi:MbtH protein
MSAYPRREVFLEAGMDDEWQDDGAFKVVVNEEEQYSIWPDGKANALGWRDEGKTGTRSECLSHIERIWTDMRPLSLRGSPEV